MKDREGRYLYANSEFNRTFRVTGEQINGKRDNELFSAEQASVFQASDRQVLETGVPMNLRRSRSKKTGNTRVLSRNFLCSTQMARSMQSAELLRILLNVSGKKPLAATVKRGIAW